MNRAYKLVWNTVSNSWMVASELAKGAKKSSGKTLKLAVFMAAGFSAGVAPAAPAINALPTGESVASGSASFDRSVTNQLTVNQSSSKLITNWNSFDVGSSGKVVFAQPDAASIALNRVTSGSATEIFGQVTANGQLVIVNPNGITFGAGSQVSAASIIGSVLDIQDSDFNAGTLLFSRGAATGSIDNKGSLSATAGSVSLLAPTVKNSGTISATGGNTALINADVVDLTTVDPAITTAFTITGLIQNSGNITATQVSSVGGKILLTGDSSQTGSVVELTGTLTADVDSAVSASQIKVAGVLDLNGTNNTLKLSSTSPYNLTFGSKINLNGASSGFSVNGTAYTVIRDVNQLQGMNTNLAGKYVLAKDVDASSTSTWNFGAGFAPVGTDTSRFSGALDGLGHAVNGLTINRPGTDFVGLIGSAGNSLIQNIGISGSVRGGGFVGSLVGNNNNSSVNNSYATASVTGTYFVGGLIGQTNGSSVGNSYATGQVTGGTYWIGGLVGNNHNSLVNNSYATGNVSGTSYIGGLVGNNTSLVSNSYATGNVTGNYNIGGLIGANDTNNLTFNVIVSNSYATGSVTGSASSLGGLVGFDNGGLITNSYWDVNTTGRASAVGGTDGNSTLTNLIAVYGNSATSPSAYSQSSYANLNFSTNWFMAEGASRPMLRAFLNTADSNGKIAVSNLYQLQGMAANLAGNYYLTQDIDAAATAASVLAGNASNRSDVWGGRGFAPVGNNSTNNISSRFSGVLDGLGHVVNGLSINRPTTDYVALFGSTQGSTLQNIGLSNINIIGNQNVGGLVGFNTTSSIVTNSYASGSVSGGGYVGGLVGYNFSLSTVTNSYASGSVSGNQYVGGLAGLNTTSSKVTNSYASGSVTGDQFVGGLVGIMFNNSSVTNSYASGSVTGNQFVGGLVGINQSNASVTNSYANGSVTGSNTVGGLVGYNDSTVTNSYWDTQNTGQAGAVGQSNGGTLSNLVGLSSSQMKNLSSFANWGSTIDAQGGTGSVWRIYEGQSGPLLRSFLKPLNVGNDSKTYDATAFTGSYSLPSGTDGSKVFGSATVSGNAIGAINAGIYSQTVSGLYSAQNGYDISDTGTVNINKARLSISATDVTKTYDGTTAAAGSAVAIGGTQLFGSDNLSGGSFTFANKNAGSGKTLTVSGVVVNDGNNGGNYDVTYTDNTNSTINKAALVLTTTDVSKTYDGTTTAAGTAIVSSGALFDTDAISGGTFAFSNKNAGTGKTVTTSAVTVDDGNSGNNYDVTFADNTNSTINKAALVLTTTDVSKTYDGTTTAAGTAVTTSGTELFTGDSISGGTFAFDNKNAGTGKTVTTSAVTVDDGNSGNNYNVTFVDNTNSTINKAALVLTSTDVTKTYDGTNTAAGTALATSGTQVFAGDSISGGTFAFDNKNAGTGKTVAISGVIVNDGNSGNNYALSYADNTSSTIDKRLLTISAVADSKVFDGKLNSAGKPVVVGRQRGDSIAGLTQSFVNKNAGTGKTINVDASYVIRDGNNGNNYDVVLVNSTAGVITPKTLTISTVSNTKVYDGGVTSANKPVVTGLISGDRVTGLFQQYETKTVGENKKLLIKNGYVVQDGNAGGNYSVVQQTSNDGVITVH